MERKAIVKALVGLHNYNLNLPNSDKDYKIYVMPTREEMYEGRFYVSNQKVGEDDYSYHDIRKMPEHLRKANVNFLEVLCSKELTSLIELPNPDEIIAEYIPNFISAYRSIFYQYLTRWEKSDFRDLKAAANVLRINSMLCEMAKGKSFSEAILSPSQIKRIKQALVSRDLVKLTIDEVSRTIDNWAEAIWKRSSLTGATERFEKLVYEYVWNNI